MGACGSKEVIDDPTSPTIAASADCHTPRSHLRRSLEDPTCSTLKRNPSHIESNNKFGHNGAKPSPEPVSRSGLQRELSVRELDPNRPAASQLTWMHPSNSQSGGLGREPIGVSPLSITNTNSNTSGVPLSARGSSSTTTPRVSKDRDLHAQALALALGNSAVAAGKQQQQQQQFILSTPNSARESNSRPGTPGDKKDQLFMSLDGKSQPGTARTNAELVNITFSPTYEGEPSQSPHVVPSIVQPGATYPVPTVLLQSQVSSSPTSQNSIIPPPPSNSVPLSSIPASMGMGMPTLVRSRSSSPSPMTPTRRAKLGLRGSEGSIYAPSTRTLPQSSNMAPELAQFQADLNGAQITNFNTSELQSANPSVHGSPTDGNGRSRGLRIDLDSLPGSVRTETPSPSRVPAHLNVAAFKKAYASAYAKIQAKNAAREMREKDLAASGTGELVKPFALAALGVLGPRHSRPGSNNNSPRQSLVTLQQNAVNNANATNADIVVKAEPQQQFSMGVLGEPRPASRAGQTASQSVTVASSTNVSAPASNSSAPSTAAVSVPPANEERGPSAAVTTTTSVAGSPVPGSSSPFLSASSKAFFDSAALAPYMTPSNILNEDMPHFHEAYKQWFREEIARERAERKQRPANHSPSRSLFSTPRHRPEMDGNGNPLDSSDLESMPIVGDRIPVGNFDTSGMMQHPNAVYDGASGAQTPTTPGGGPMTLFGLLRESNSRAGSGANTPLGSQPPSLAQGLIASGFASVGSPGSGSPIIRSSPVMRNSSLLGSSHRRAADSPSHGRHYTPIHLPSAAAAAATSNNSTTYQHPLALYSDSSGLIT